MQKTLLVSDDFPPRLGGVAAYYGALCQYLPIDRLSVLTEPRAGSAVYDATVAFPIIRTGLLSRNALVWPRWITALRCMERLRRQRRYAQMLVGQILPYGTAAWILHRWRGVPYAVIVHGMDIAIPRGRRRYLCGKILRDAKIVVANSHATKERLQPYEVPPNRIHVLTPGVQPPQLPSRDATNELRARYGVGTKRILLTVGRLVARKGHRAVLEVLPRLAKKFSDLVYVIAGDGPKRADLERFVDRLHMRSHVIFTGALSPLERNAWYESCEIFVMVPEPVGVGDVEGFGMTYLEAASFAKPAVASAVPGVSEAVVDGLTGCLVPPGDTGALLDALTRLFGDPAYAHRLGIQGQDRVSRDFRWEDRARRLAGLLE